jgi:hypothetical protein
MLDHQSEQGRSFRAIYTLLTTDYFRWSAVCPVYSFILRLQVMYASNKVVHSWRDLTLRIMGQDPLTKFYTIPP